ncbi:unnamed protein product [Amaranthus hypochondriacus]
MSSFNLFSTPQQQQQQSPFSFQTQSQQQSNPFMQQTQQQQQQQLQFQQHQQQQQQLQQQQQQQLFLFTNDKTPASYSTKWADLHPDSQKVLLQIEERVLEYRDESQRLDQCSRLFDSSVANNTFELDASRILQELGGISTSMERQKVTLQELMAVVKEMLRNAEIAIRSFMMLRPRFLHQKAATASNLTAQSQTPGATTGPGSAGQAAANSMVAVSDFYSGIPKKPSPFMQQTVSRFEKYLGECRQWIDELEQLLLSDFDRNSINFNSSVLQSLPKVLTNVHEFFVHVAAKVESIHQYIESMRTAYLNDQRRRGDAGDPFLEADRREIARQEAAAKRVHPTLHLPAAPQPTTQVAGLFASSATPGVSSAPPTSGAPTSSSTGMGFPNLLATSANTSSSSLFSTPSSSSLFSTPSSVAGSSLFTAPTASQSSPFSSSTPSLFAASTPSLFGGSTPASTPAGGSLFSTPFGSGAALGSGSSFNATNRARPRSRTSRR